MKSKANHFKKKKIKNEFLRNYKDYNNYSSFSKETNFYPNEEEDQPHYNIYHKIYKTKKSNYANISLDEIELENMYSKINDSFYDKKNDRDSLILQIEGTKSIKEVKYKKPNKKRDNFLLSPARIKTPEKMLKDIKRKVKARKIKQKNESQINNIVERNYGQELNNYNNNIITATFNEEKKNKKYNEFTFNKDEDINNTNYLDNNINYNYEEKRNGGKIDLFYYKEKKEESNYNNKDNKDNFSKDNNISIDSDNKKNLNTLNVNKIINKKRKKFLLISKSQDLLKLPFKKKIKTKENKNYLGNKGKLDKKLLKEIIDENRSPRILEKEINQKYLNAYEENSPRKINHSFDAPLTYQKKIIKNSNNLQIKKKKSEFKNQRVNTEDKINNNKSRNRNSYINYSNSKTNENSISSSSVRLNNINYNNSLNPINKRLIYSDGNKNIISNYYNNNFYNTPIKNYLEQSSFYIGYTERSRSLNKTIKSIINKNKKNKNYNHTNKKENCINISLNSNSINLNDSFFINNNTINNCIFPKYKINPISNYEYKSPRIKLNKIKLQKKDFSINFEELMIIGEKLFDIIKYLLTNKKMANQCFEFWNYLFNSSLPKEVNSLILNSELKDAISSINYTLMSILICYDYSFDLNLIERCFSLIKETVELIINNYIIFCKFIIKKVSKKNQDNKWIYKLNNMLSKNKNYSNITNDINNNYIINIFSSTEKINYNTNIIIKNLKIILENFKSNSNESLLTLFKKILQKTYDDINYYYTTFLLREENINGSFLASLYLKDNPNFHSASKPYIKTPNNKKYTLVLDLEETLINFRLKSEKKEEGTLKMRPGLYEFLDEIQFFYEIIIFTASSQDYAEALIDTIEESKKYFKYKFYRQHNIVIENDFVKDLSRIGRDLDKMIIVDNIPQNYRLHKKNGINIKGFWGEDLCDRALYNLKDILIKLAEEGGDLRDGLIKYHEDIVEKVTSNIYKFNFE